MGEEKKKTGARYTVAGDYYIRQGDKGRAIKTYRVEVCLPEVRKDALSIIKNKILDLAIKKKYPDSIGYRTHVIVKTQILGDENSTKLSIDQKDRNQVIDMIAEEDLPVEAKLYPDLSDLRAAVIEAQADPDSFAKRQASKKEELELNKSIMDANPELSPARLDEEPEAEAKPEPEAEAEASAPEPEAEAKPEPEAEAASESESGIVGGASDL